MSEADPGVNSRFSDFWASVADRRFASVEDPSRAVGNASERSILAALEQDIEDIGRMRCLFMQRRNAHVPIGRLPPEVLAHIFWLTPGCGVLHSSTFSIWPEELWIPERKSTIMITHVCSQWRAVALAHGNLWSHIELDKQCKWVPYFLARSAGHDLAVTIRPNRFFDISILGPQDWSRICSLQAYSTISELFELPPSAFQSLKSLCISDYTRSRSTEERVPLFSPSCQIAAGSLSTLYLHNIPTSWENFPSFPQLTSLELWNKPPLWRNSGRVEFPDFNTMVNVMHRVPCLQTLRLATVFPDEYCRNIPSADLMKIEESIIPFPNLTDLYIEGFGDVYAFAFNAMEMHPQVSAWVEISLNPSDFHASEVLFTKCSRLLPYPYSLHLYLVKEGGRMKDATLWLWDKYRYASDLRFPVPNLRVKLLGPGPAHSDFTYGICRLPLSEIVLLDVNFRDMDLWRTDSDTIATHVHLHPIHHIFRDCSSVTHLEISSITILEKLLPALANDLPPIPDHVASEENAPFFPSLRCLKLIVLWPKTGEAIVPLIEALRKRYEDGGRLQELNLGSPPIASDEQKADLQQFVEKSIVWKS
ncbi:hypothetical protein DENSPDRAFT_841353 [Dentipellis sp. KUC8613]|nr:hypothetical protein DENSPDRAFT_841353 [Dentipellis sp. KUC8613]